MQHGFFTSKDPPKASKTATNRAERRRQMRAEGRQRQTAWRASVRELSAQAAGVLDIGMIRPASPRSPIAVAVVANWFDLIESGARPSCLSCETQFGPGVVPAAFFVAAPARDDPWALFVIGVCKGCAARSDRELLDVASGLLRQIWPKLRPIDRAHLPHAAGTA